MLYLFNSGYRPLYVRNVLNTLFLPEGCTNEYRYRYVGDPRHVLPAVYGQLRNLASGTECVVTFIDRFGATGYNYHPLRRGKYLSYRTEDDYVFFRIQFDAFLYPRNLDEFRNQLEQALGPEGLPQLTENDPMNSSDGAYAILADSIFGQDEEYLQDDRAWTAAVGNLSETRALATNADQSPIFLKAEIRSASTKRIVPIIRDGASIYKLEKNKSYELSLTYRFPKQRTDQDAIAQAEIKLGDNLKALGPMSVSFDSHANSVPVPFISKHYVEDISGSITMSPVDKTGQPNLLMAEYSLRYEIRESTAFWVKLAAALLMFSLAGTFIGVDYSSLSPFSLPAFFNAAWPQLIAGIIQTAALFFIFRLIGKKVV